MSRFVLDCAVVRPVDTEAAQWLATAAIRGFAPTNAPYHEAKISQAFLQEAARTVAVSLGGSGVEFAADTATAVGRALTDQAALTNAKVIATSAADPMILRDVSAQKAHQLGMRHVVLPVDDRGRIAELPDHAILVTSLANQEIGSLQRDLGPWSQATGSPLVFDVSCAVGWTPLPQRWDRLIVDPRAWGAPAGAAVVVTRQTGLVPDFDNVAAAVAAGLTLQRWLQVSDEAQARVTRQVRHLVDRVRNEVPDAQIYGGTSGDVPHIVSLSVLYVDAEALATTLDAAGFGVGSGSACASLTGQPSHVLSAIGGLTSGNARLGLPPDLPDEVIDAFVDCFRDSVAAIRDQLGTRNI